MRDKTLICIEYGAEFIFSVAEQFIFHRRGYQDPKRCKACRAKRRSARSDSQAVQAFRLATLKSLIAEYEEA